MNKTDNYLDKHRVLQRLREISGEAIVENSTAEKMEM